MSTTRRHPFPLHWHPQWGGYHYGIPGQPPLCGATADAPVQDATHVYTRQHGWQYRCNVCAAACGEQA